MRKLTEAEVRDMSPLEVSAVVCEGLAEVCSGLAYQADSKEQSDKFVEYERDFQALSKLFHSVKNPKRKAKVEAKKEMSMT